MPPLPPLALAVDWGAARWRRAVMTLHLSARVINQPPPLARLLDRGPDNGNAARGVRGGRRRPFALHPAPPHARAAGRAGARAGARAGPRAGAPAAIGRTAFFILTGVHCRPAAHAPCAPRVERPFRFVGSRFLLDNKFALPPLRERPGRRARLHLF